MDYVAYGAIVWGMQTLSQCKGTLIIRRYIWSPYWWKMVIDLVDYVVASEWSIVCSSWCQGRYMVPSLEVFYILQGIINIVIGAHVGHLEHVGVWSYHYFWDEWELDWDS